MNAKKAIAASIKASTIAAFSLIVAAGSPVLADVTHYNRGVSVFDNFDHLYLRPDHRAYWYVESMGVLADGTEGRVREVNCALQTCQRQFDETVNGVETSFVRLEDHPYTLTNNQYINSNLSEDVDGADGDPVYGDQTYPAAWNPSVGHPVVLESRFRLSSNMHSDGSGGAHGTAGVVLWNNPFSQGNPNPLSIYDLLGFTWASNDSIVIGGLNVAVAKGATPLYFQPILGVNPTDWNTYKMVWSTDILGNQTATYYVNGYLTAVVAIPVAETFHNMGIEAWIDDQTFTANGIGRTSITENQNIDIDYVSIYKS